jgi:hypothetical protein
MTDYDSYKLGETDELIKVSQRDELASLILAMSRQANQRILIFSRDLENSIFGNTDLYEAVKELAIRSQRTHIDILVQDLEHILKEGHRLLQLTRRISSHMTIKVTAKEHQDILENFLIFDDRAYIVRENPYRYEAEGNFYAPLHARRLEEQFTEMWERGYVDVSLRRLHL